MRASTRPPAFSLVLEHIPANVAAQVTESLNIPTIGLGAGPLGDWTPPFAEAFGNVPAEMENAVESYVDAVESGQSPAEEYSHVE